MKLKLERKNPRIELIPLVDIIFLLLVFFIYSMLSMAVYRGIPVMLPTAQSVESAKEEALFVTLDRDGNIYVDRGLIPVDRVLDRFRNEQLSSPGKTAIISADGETPYSVFVDVLDKIRIAGFQKISIEATPEEAQPQ